MMDEKILFVDDDFNILEGYKRQLRKKFRIETVLEGGEGLTAVTERSPYAVVISDLRMPGMSGIEFLSRVKTISPDSVRMMLTGYADLKTAMEAVNEGNIFRFLTKPCQPDILADALTAGIEQYRLKIVEREVNKKIKILSITDPLTGCYNRGYLAERLQREISISGRYGHWLSIVLCDIDHFKTVNDRYGHQAGDDVLIAFVQCINQSIRNDVDWLVRYGGEEFLIVLPETGLEGVCAMTERLRKIVSQNKIEIQGKTIQITASFGATSIKHSENDKEISLESMISTADKYLYQAKKEGRNRLIGGPLLF